MTASKIFLYFCLSFIGGIFLNSIFSINQLGFLTPHIILCAGLIFGLILISVLWRYKKFVVIGFCLLFLVAGIWRHQIAELQITNSKLRIYNDREDIVTFIGIISAEPDIREKSQKLTIEIKQLNYYAAGSRSEKERVLVTANRYPEYRYGDKLKIIGKLETPPVFESFNYKDYLAKDGIFSVMSFPEIELMNRGDVRDSILNKIMKAIFSLKNKFKTATGSFISSPQVGILEALIFGDEEKISKEWKDKLNFTGTRHITAVSGMNITIIASLILSFALSLGLWRQQASYLTIFLLLLYILMIGFPASAVRAGIMAILFLIAQYFGRLSSASRAIIFAATFMLAQNPLLLRLDVGFQLSFLAIMGIIYLQPAFSEWLKKIPNPKAFPLRATLSATLSAQIFTLPILIYNFGYIPLVSPLTNILIVPFLAPITILIFIFGITGMIFSPLAFILSWPTWLSLTYIISIVNYFSKLSFASLSLKISWIWLIISYLILALITWRLQERKKLKFLDY